MLFKRTLLSVQRSPQLCRIAMSFLIGTVVSAPTFAQTNNDTVLEEVMVYGEKIGRSYLDTYTSVGVVDAQDIEAYDLGDTSEAYLRMANVRAFTQGAGSKSISIRGLEADGTTDPQNSAGLISLVIDGVTQSAEGLKRGSRGLWDVEQIEVYRGPQGTIQGRNSLAGTVVVNTKNPSFEPEGKIKLTYGELDRKELAFAVSAPIVGEELAFRLSGEKASRESDITFTDAANAGFAEDSYQNVRGKLLYRPAAVEQLEILLTVNVVEDEPAYLSVSGPDFYRRTSESDSSYSETRKMDLKNYVLNAAWDNQNGMVIRSITAYNDTDLEIASLPSSKVFLRDGHRKDSDFQQEFRVEVNEGLGAITGVGGLYYSQFKQNTDTSIQYFAGSLDNLFYRQVGTAIDKTDSWAVYADLRYALSSEWDILFGGRYQRDKVSTGFDLELLSGNLNEDLSLDNDVFLPKLGVAWSPSDNQSVALTVSRGYRQGFQTLHDAAADPEPNGVSTSTATVDPEFAWTYDIAYRQSLFNNAFTLGVNIFYNDYTDQQISVIVPNRAPRTNTLNVGESESYGAELEMQYMLSSEFSIYGALGLLETELGNFNDAQCPNENCAGNEYAEAPNITASLGGQYRHSSGFYASLSASYTGKSYASSFNNSDSLELDDYILLNTKIGYDFEYVNVSAYVSNLLDEDYLTGLVSEDRAYVGDGRAAGVEVTVSF